MRRVAGALLAAALVASGCRTIRHVREPSGKDRAAAGGEASGPKVPPRAGRPAVPSSPRGLLARDAVVEIQAALARRGALGPHRRGELDRATSAGLRRFQREEGLAETGFPDRETLTRLGVDPERAYRKAGSAGR